MHARSNMAAAAAAGLDWEPPGPAPSSTGPALLLQLCCLQCVSCCSSAGGLAQAPDVRAHTRSHRIPASVGSLQ